MSIWSVRVQFKYLSVSIGPVSNHNSSLRALTGGSNLLLTLGDKLSIQLLSFLFPNVAMVLHYLAFGFASQCSLRDD